MAHTQESAASFLNSNSDHSDVSDIDGDNNLPDFVKCDVAKIDDSLHEENDPIKMRNSRTRSQNVKRNPPSLPTPKSKKPKTEDGIKGFTIDADNRYHCLDCGKKFKQKASYNQHQRL